MPSIGEMSQGYDKDGVETYLDQLKAIVLTQAADAVKDISKIKSCCDNHWEGQAKENFIANLSGASEHVADQFNALYKILEGEINSAQAAMANKDQELIQLH